MKWPLTKSALLGAIFLASAAGAVAQDVPPHKSDLRVLFVGHDPADPKVPFQDLATDRTYALYQERTPAFEEFLRQRFRNVQVVFGDDYRVGMSDEVDVTIFDARPKELTPVKREVDPDTGETLYEPASYLPLSFDRPALLIAENSPRIGEPLGLKLDWL